MHAHESWYYEEIYPSTSAYLPLHYRSIMYVLISGLIIHVAIIESSGFLSYCHKPRAWSKCKDDVNAHVNAKRLIGRATRPQVIRGNHLVQ